MAKHTTEGYTVTFDATDIAGLSNLPWPENERPEIDVTDLASSGIETLPALPDGGTADFECFFEPDDAGQQALITNHALGDGTTGEVIITAPATSTTETTPGNITFDAYVQSWQVEAGVNEAAMVTFTLRVQGDPVYTDPVT